MVTSAVRERISNAKTLHDLVRKRFSQSGSIRGNSNPDIDNMKGRRGRVVRFLYDNANRWISSDTLLQVGNCNRAELAQVKRDMNRAMGYTVETKLGPKGKILSYRFVK